MSKVTAVTSSALHHNN